MSRASLAQRRGPNAIADQLPDKSLTALFYSRPWIVLSSALLLCLDAHACAPELATGVFAHDPNFVRAARPGDEFKQVLENLPFTDLLYHTYART